MEWFDLPNALTDEPGGVLEMPAAWSLPGMALEMHVFVLHGDETYACWLLEDGTYLATAPAGTA
jgi:hypothetical protein